MNTITQNIEQIRSRIKLACGKAGRDSSGVKIVLATKTVEPERIIHAFEAGEILMAENKVQEIKEKFEALSDFTHQTHFIGHLQTNKIKEILRYNVSCIQSLDRLELAEKLHQRLLAEKKKMDVMIQVNTSNEESKFGVSPEKALELVRRIAGYETLQIIGLMTIGLFSAEAEVVRPSFKILRKIKDEIVAAKIDKVQMRELSMGMSGDLETAIEEGATMIRIGTAIFGERIYANR